MTKDLLEAALFATITTLFLGLLWALLVFGAWLIVCKFLRRQELDSDYEHISHSRHRDLYHR